MRSTQKLTTKYARRNKNNATLDAAVEGWVNLMLIHLRVKNHKQFTKNRLIERR